MKVPITIQLACQVLRSRVRYKSAWLHLPGPSTKANDTEVIREATKVYVEAWIVPLLDMIEDGELEELNEAVKFSNRDIERSGFSA